LVEHRYALRSKGKPVLENLDRLQDEEKPIPDNMNWSPQKTGSDSGKTEPESGKTEPGSGKAEPESGKIEPEHGCEIGLWKEPKSTSVERFKEESVTKKDEVEKDGSSLDEGKTKPITEGDSVKGGDTIRTDWRLSLLECIRDPGKTTDKKIKRQALKYTLLDDDLYRRTIDCVLLKCLGEDQTKVAVWEVHDGICGAHQSAHKMNWLLWRAGVYWLTMMDECIKYQRGCKACQRFRNIQLALIGVMNSIVKRWPFRGWGLDFIDEIHPRSSKGHRFILVATDYFTKRTEIVPLRNMTHQEVISFVQEDIIYWFGVPQTLTTDQGPSFISHQFREFVESMKIMLLNSSPYYVQANGQAEASNKVLIKVIKKRIKDNPRRWHDKLSEALWAHRT
jgi:hypothetical protein